MNLAYEGLQCVARHRQLVCERRQQPLGWIALLRVMRRRINLASHP